MGALDDGGLWLHQAGHIANGRPSTPKYLAQSEHTIAMASKAGRKQIQCHDALIIAKRSNA